MERTETRLNAQSWSWLNVSCPSRLPAWMSDFTVGVEYTEGLFNGLAV